MSQDKLGLFDTPPSRREVQLALAAVAALFAAVVVLFPVLNVPSARLYAFAPIVDAVMSANGLIIGAMLYAKASVHRSRALVVLASGFVFSSLMLVSHAVTFPGAFSPTGWLGAGISTTAWVAFFQRSGLLISVSLYALLKRADVESRLEDKRDPQILASLSMVMALAILATALATLRQAVLPAWYSNATDVNLSTATLTNLIMLVLTILAMAALFRQERSVLDLWLLVSMADFLGQGILILFMRARFTQGFYGLYGLMLVSNLVIILALVAESNRRLARLALTIAARERADEARLMSMDAVAAAIAHEIGQPLAAVTLSAKSGLNWLRRTPPDPDMAIQSLRTALDAGQRTFKVIKSIRSTFSSGSEAREEFGLNELVRETLSLMDRELAVQKVALQLALEEPSPQVLGNRIQIQRVLVNVLTNAIESLAQSGRRPRRIAIRAYAEDSEVALEIRDSGVGIAPELLPRIFDAYITSKAKGTGIGLSLSRAIVEEHGGRLWATNNDGPGATFHLRMPRSPEEGRELGRWLRPDYSANAAG